MTAPATIARKQRRVLVDGRLVAAHVPEHQHGKATVYDYHYCRCIPCSEAKSKRRRELARTVEKVQSATRAELEYLVGEYKHMRGFRMSLEWACKFIGIDPEVLQRRFERNGYGHLI